MIATLYKNEEQARRVVTAVHDELHRSLSQPVRAVNGRISIAPEILAGTISTWAIQNVTLNREARTLVEYPCQRAGIVVENLGEYPLFTDAKIARGPLTDVVIVPAEQDPLFASGQFALPRSVQSRLQAMEKIGVPLDLLFTYIAHEVPSNTVDADGFIPLEVIAPPPPERTQRLSERLGAVAHTSTISALRGFRRTAAAGALGVAAGTLVAGVVVARLLDPIIFGALPDERGMATWFVLAQWVW